MGSKALARAEESPLTGHQMDGIAQANVSATYKMDVVLDPSGDPLLTSFAQRCLPCNAATDFFHDSKGAFAWDAPLIGGQAGFSEALTIQGDGTTATGRGNASVFANAFSGGSYRLVSTGMYRAQDFTAFSGQALDFFPHDTSGNVTGPGATVSPGSAVMSGLNFHHTQIFTDVVTSFMWDKDVNALVGSYTVTLTQQAYAQFVYGISAVADTQGDGILMADFSHTSHFGITGIVDPTGSVDFANALVGVRLTAIDPAPPNPVPLPAAWWGMLAGFGMIARRRRRAS
jgi:hypothetical protein